MERPRENWIRVCGLVLLLVVAAVIVWRVRGVIVTILLAVVGAYALRPVVNWLCRFRVSWRRRSYPFPRSWAALLAFILVGLVVWGFWVLSAFSLEQEFASLPARWQQFEQTATKFAAELDRYYRERLPASFRPTVDSWSRGLSGVLTAAATKGLGITFHGVGFIIELFLVPILAFYFLADGPNIRQQALFFVPRRLVPRTEQSLDQADGIFGRYIRGQVILCVIAFVVVTVGLLALRVEFYLLLGLIAGLTRAVPIIGPIVGAIPIVIVVLVTKSGGVALWVLILFSIMHLLESKLLMPAILGQQLGLHPVLIIVALLIGAQMGGLLGVFLAVPVLAAIKATIAEQRARPSLARAEPVPE